MSDQDFVLARAHHVFTETVVAARNLGDPVDAKNQGFWQVASNIISAGYPVKLDFSGPEMAALVTLSKAIAASSRFVDWASAAAISERLFGDGGEELGLGDDFIDVKDWNDPAQRAGALEKGLQFHRVPRSYQPALADVVARIMLATPDAWNYEGTQLTQPWANCCTYVVFAIAERVKAADPSGFRLDDGHHRFTRLQ